MVNHNPRLYHVLVGLSLNKLKPIDNFRNASANVADTIDCQNPACWNMR